MPAKDDVVVSLHPDPLLSLHHFLGLYWTTTLGLTDGVSWDERELALLINTLYHSDVHLNVSSTMALDAAYFDRPTVCLAYDPRPGSPFGALCRRMYDREHYVDIVRSGGVTLAESPEAAVSAVTAYLESPDLNAENRRKMLKMYDPFVDGRAAERTASKILELA